MGGTLEPCEMREILIMHLTRSEKEGQDWVVFWMSLRLRDETCLAVVLESAKLLL
jgi:hypothetical protein